MTIDLSRLIAAERAALPPAAPDAGLERLLTALGAQVAPLPVAAGALKLGGSLVAKWVGVGFAVGLAGAGAASQVWAPSETPAPRVVSSAPSIAARAAPAAHNAQAMPAPSAAPAPTMTSPLRSAASTPPPAPVTVTPAIDEELRLITRAKQQLDAQRPHLALVWLNDHEQRFPGGVFAIERRALSIVARCSQRPNPALAHDFAMSQPGSPLVAQLRRVCGATAAPAPIAPSAGDFSRPANAAEGLGEPTTE